MITKDNIVSRRAQILAIGEQYGAHDFQLFGSIARGDATETSDLDMIVRFDRERSLLDHAGLIGALEDFLGIKVDVIDADGMRPRFRAEVEREAVPL